ncbi:uncharacterized protein LOC134672619 [Cydia fagiglandana]|uniref:uncharacterized protein LOC134672619 n=1 Tax=Cydia fagiglandana TaxID=1458189 RepID=UPI002FEDEBAA
MYFNFNLSYTVSLVYNNMMKYFSFKWLAKYFKVPLISCVNRHGDLSKPSDGPHGKELNTRRWAELTQLLNADATGVTKNTDKWRKVWSDLKNNTKKKAARIFRAGAGTGGGPACTLKLSDLEQRVLAITGTRAATGIVEIPEVGLEVG